MRSWAGPCSMPASLTRQSMSSRSRPSRILRDEPLPRTKSSPSATASIPTSPVQPGLGSTRCLSRAGCTCRPIAAGKPDPRRSTSGILPSCSSMRRGARSAPCARSPGETKLPSGGNIAVQQTLRYFASDKQGKNHMTKNGNGSSGLGHGYYFEDLIVGMEASVSKKITNEDVLVFADLSGDVNPVHLSDDF